MDSARIICAETQLVNGHTVALSHKRQDVIEHIYDTFLVTVDKKAVYSEELQLRRHIHAARNGEITASAKAMWAAYQAAIQTLWSITPKG